MARIRQIVLGVFTLVGSLAYFIPPVWDHEAWKNFAGIDMPDYPSMLSSSVGQSFANIMGLILLFISIYLLFIIPNKNTKKSLDELRSQIEARPGERSAGNTFINCQIYGNNTVVPAQTQSPSTFSGTVHHTTRRPNQVSGFWRSGYLKRWIRSLLLRHHYKEQS